MTSPSPATTEPASTPAPPAERQRWFRRPVATCVWGLLVILAAFYVLRAPILCTAARLWIINDPPAHADAIVLLGGGLDTRPFAAARLYRDGYAPRILFTQPKPTAANDLGLTTPDEKIARQILLKEGVPDSALLGIGNDVQTTYAESLAVCDWAKTNHVTRLIVPTDIFHTRRVRWVFGKQLRHTGVQVLVEAVPVREYTQADWWQHEQGVVAFQNEILKLAYYHLKY